MTLLAITQSVAVLSGLGKPTVAAASTDAAVLRIVELANEDGQELAGRHSWQVLRKEATLTTVAAESQGSIGTITGPDFAFIVNETMWNRSQRRPVFGPRSPAEWQQLKGQFSSGPWIQYMLRANLLLFLPTPAAGQSVFFEWISKYWCSDSTGATAAATMTADTDVTFLDERLIKLGTLWRFRKSIGMAYEEDFNTCEGAINDAITRDGSKGRLNLDGQQVDIYPGIVVPAGNWPL